MEDKKSNGGCAAGCLGGCLLSSLLIVLILVIICFMPILGFFSMFGGSNSNSPTTNSNNPIIESPTLVLGFVSPFAGGFRFTAPDYPYDGTNHTGEDLGPIGNDNTILAMHSGKVIYTYVKAGIREKQPSGAPNSKLQDFGGNQVVIEFEHENWPGQKVFLNFCHMKTVTVNIGEEVKQGQSIGTMGETGGASGPHLHLILAVGPTWEQANSIPPRLILQPESSQKIAQTDNYILDNIVLISTRKGELYE